MTEKCCSRLRSGFRRFCTRNATVTHEGFPYCGQHYPPAIKLRNEKRDREARMRRDQRAKLRDENQRRRELKAEAIDILRSIAWDAIDDPGGAARAYFKRVEEFEQGTKQ